MDDSKDTEMWHAGVGFSYTHTLSATTAEFLKQMLGKCAVYKLKGVVVGWQFLVPDRLIPVLAQNLGLKPNVSTPKEQAAGSLKTKELRGLKNENLPMAGRKSHKAPNRSPISRKTDSPGESMQPKPPVESQKRI